MAVEVFDLECFPNFFSYTGKNKDTGEVVQIYISEYESPTSLVSLFEHVFKGNLTGLVGFNNLNYDYPMLHYIYEKYNQLKGLSSADITARLFAESQRIINTERSAIPHWKWKINQLDLYRIYHFDNKAKITSLKDVEIALDFPVVQDLPFKYTHMVRPHEIEEVLKYNLNDVEATFEFYKRSKGMIDMRKSLGKEFGLNLLNANDPKIGSEIFVSLISQETGIDIKDIKGMRTPRASIDLGECVLPNVKFQSKEFSNLVTKIKNTTITQTKGAMEHSVIYKGFKYDFGLGGIHGCIKPGIYIADDQHYIYDIDVTSFYPNLAIKYGFHPEHFGKEFCRIYESVFNKRAVAKKAGNKVVDAGLKLGLNGVYGG